MFNKISIIGCGLIGSSILRAVNEKKLASKICVYDKSSKVTDYLKKNFSVETSNNITDVVKDSDLVIIASPLSSYKEILLSIHSNLKENVILTDTGSAKKEVNKIIRNLNLKNVNWIASHPIAGTEYSGPEAGFANLFNNRWCLLTPLENTDEQALKNLIEMWSMIGARVETMDPKHHDLVLAVTSHSPHLIAYTMVGVADDLGKVTDSEVIKYSAAGFRDFTRIAASDPVMWRDVFLSNKEATLEILGRFTEELFDLQRAIRTGNGDKLLNYFTHTRSVRRGIIEAGQDTDVPNFGRNLEADVD